MDVPEANEEENAAASEAFDITASLAKSMRRRASVSILAAAPRPRFVFRHAKAEAS